MNVYRTAAVNVQTVRDASSWPSLSTIMAGLAVFAEASLAQHLWPGEALAEPGPGHPRLGARD